MKKEYNMGLSFCPLYHLLKYRFPVLFPFKRVPNLGVHYTYTIYNHPILQLSSLHYLCESHLATLLTPHTVASLLILSDSCRCEHLKRRALQYCREHHQYIIKDKDWTTMEQDKPLLFEEAVRQVATVTCSTHMECVKNTRYRVVKGVQGVQEVQGGEGVQGGQSG